MEKPNKSASHPEWAEYAINGPLRVPSYEAWNMTKDELITRCEVPVTTAAKLALDPQDIGPGHGALYTETHVDPGTVAPVAPTPAPEQTVATPKTTRGRARRG